MAAQYATTKRCGGVLDAEEKCFVKKNVLWNSKEVKENCEFYCQGQNRNAAPRVMLLQRMSPER